MPAIASAMFLALGQLADTRMLRLLAKSMAITLLLFALTGWLGWIALDRGLAWAGLGDGLFPGADGLRGIASTVLVLIAGWLLWRIIAMAVIGFFADEVVLAVERRHYPQYAAQARDLPLKEQASASIAAAGRALIVNIAALPFALALLFTGIGTALLFWIVNAILIGRELQDMVWLRHRHNAAPDAREKPPLNRAERFALGGATAAMLLIPFAAFLAPLIGAASATHLTHRKRSAQNA